MFPWTFINREEQTDNWIFTAPFKNKMPERSQNAYKNKTYYLIFKKPLIHTITNL